MKIELIRQFNKELKFLLKKYPSLFHDLNELVESLKNNPIQGIPIGRNCYKIRLKISSKNQGKSGGARVITHVYIEGETITLLSIYDKSEQTDIKDEEIIERLKEING